MLPFLAKTVICSGLFYGLYYFLLSKETFFHLNRLFLWASLGFAMLIPLLHISLNFTPTSESLLLSFISKTKDFFFVYLLDEVIVYGKASPLSWYNIVEKIYFTGIFVFFGRMLFFLYKILKINSKARKHKMNGVVLFIHEKPYTAFSFGNAIYVNKHDFQSENFRLIWQHELTHIKYGHTFESLILELICCICWFNPFVWAIKKQLKNTHEFQVDNALICKGIDTITYQKKLLNYTLGSADFATANHFASTDLKNRVTMLAKKQSKRWKKGKIIVALPVILLLLFAFSTELSHYPEVSAQPKQYDKSVLLPILDTIPAKKQ